jgi:hypothetical protein
VSVGIVPHDHAGRVTRKTLGRFRGNVRAAVEDRLAGRLGVGEDRSVDVDDDLVALIRRARIETMVQDGLGDEGERVRLLLLHRR